MIQPTPPIDNLILIVAGNYKQAQRCARKHGIYPRHWAYVGNPDRLKNASGHVLYHGTYFQRHDLQEIEAEISANPNLKKLELE